MSTRPGWTIRTAYVAECGNCGAWSPPEPTPEAAAHSEAMTEVDGVAYCHDCAPDMAD